VLEEGVATRFSHYVSDSIGRGYRGTLAAYVQAEALVYQLFRINIDAVAQIRAKVPLFSNICSAHIKSVAPDIPDVVAQELTRPFRDWKTQFEGSNAPRVAPADNDDSKSPRLASP
jgi:hypothetical protein